MNSTIEKIRNANYGPSNNKRTKNVMFCLLVKATLPSAQLAIVRFNNVVTLDSPVVLYQNLYWNLLTPNGVDTVDGLNHDVGRLVPDVREMIIISPGYLQSRLNFFEANQVVKMFNTLQCRTPTMTRPQHVPS